MAKFEQVLEAMRAGKKVRRKMWGYDDFCYIDGKSGDHINIKSILATDWEVVPEPEPDPEPEPEPQWLLLEPGMRIRTGDEFRSILGWIATELDGAKLGENKVYRRRIKVAK